MIITIAGKAGSGKSTVAKLLASRLGYKHYSMGDFMSELASEKEMSVLEISKLAETDIQIDKAIDQKQKDLANSEENFVIDSRLGFHFIPNSVKIFLDVDDEVAAKRIFGAKRDDEKENTSFEVTKENIIKRVKSEILRYEKYYGLNPYEHSNFDLLVDTSEDSPEQIVENILKYLDKLK